MNIKFEQWLKQQDYAWNSTPRKSGWMIWSVNRDMTLNSEQLKHITSHKWRWEYILICTLNLKIG